MMEYARAEKINRSRRGMAPVLAGAATMFSVRGAALRVPDARAALRADADRGLRAVARAARQRLRDDGATDLQGADGPDADHADAVGAARALVSRRVREPARARLHAEASAATSAGWRSRCGRPRRAGCSCSRSRVTVLTVGHMSFSPWLLAAVRLRLDHPDRPGARARLEVHADRGADGRGALLRLLPRGGPVALGVSRLLRQTTTDNGKRERTQRMYPNAPTLFIFTDDRRGRGDLSTVGFSVVWIVFAVTLVVTTAVAIHRSIPRKERRWTHITPGRPIPRLATSSITPRSELAMRRLVFIFCRAIACPDASGGDRTRHRPRRRWVDELLAQPGSRGARPRRTGLGPRAGRHSWCGHASEHGDLCHQRWPHRHPLRAGRHVQHGLRRR